jgi:hypothetical protein
MNDLPLTTNLTDLPIGTLLRKRNGQVRKMIAIASDHPDAPIVLDDGCCVAVNGKAGNWPINDIIGIAGWPPLDTATTDRDLAAACREWIKGCTCAIAARPQDCRECTAGFLNAVLGRAQVHGLTIGSNAFSSDA